jgi:endonuclease/exonuclease/phosphatase family metal-dependent hydrolase
LPPLRIARGLIAGAAALMAVAAPASAATSKADVTVMSRNLYLGADIIKLATAKDEADEMQQAAALHAVVDQTNFPARAKAIVKEIKATKPDIVGLQEVARFYRGPDGVHDKTTNASTVLYDWLAILRKELKAQGLSYRVAVEQKELDVETASAEGYDLRLTLGNAVLVRTGKGAHVKVTKTLKGVFSHQLDVPLKDQTVHVQRGYAGIDASVGGKKLRFLDPHAEAYSDADATGQLKELLSKVASSKKLTTVIAGDFNSSPDRGDAYNTVIKAGFWDTGKKAGTCCEDETLTNASPKLDQWIDHIVVRPRVTVVARKVVGNRAADRVSGLWPSDHAGVVATLRLK